jgi:hypothetical protein
MSSTAALSFWYLAQRAVARAQRDAWRELVEKLASPDGLSQLPKVVLGVEVADGIEVVRSQSSSHCRLTLSVT